MTLLEKQNKIDELTAMLKKALVEPCTCYDEPEEPCRYCNLITHSHKIMVELGFYD